MQLGLGSSRPGDVKPLQLAGHGHQGARLPRVQTWRVCGTIYERDRPPSGAAPTSRDLVQGRSRPVALSSKLSRVRR